MSTASSIEWTDATWNPVRGCAVISAGCTNCYAMKFAHRFSGEGNRYQGLTRNREHGGPVWTGKVETVPHMLDAPLRWQKPRKVFVNSMSDLFHEDVPDEYIAAVFGVMAATPRHTYQILTKRAERAAGWFGWVAKRAESGMHPEIDMRGAACAVASRDGYGWGPLPPLFKEHVGRLPISPKWPLPNVWMGVSVEDQTRADERIPWLLRCPAAVRFLSVEPMLGPITLRAPEVGDRPEDVATLPIANHEEWDDWKYWAARDRGVSWVIVGGESGPGARPMDLAWAQSIVAQCKAANVACFVKQLGARPVYDCDIPGVEGRTPLDLRDKKGGDINEFPEDLRVRQWPR